MTVGEGVILGMGNPLLDISANVTPEFLDKYDLKRDNAILAEDKHQAIYEDICKNFESEFIPGGATQNAIRVAQWLLNTKHACVFIGCIGNDDYGKKMQECAAQDNIRAPYMIDPNVPTGTCAVCVQGVHRSLVANLAAANNYKVEHIQKPENWAIVEKAQIFYMAGFFLTVCPPAIQLVAQHAAETNKLFCMNLSAPFLSQFFKDPMLAAAPYWDIIFGNESEALEFSRQNNYQTEDIKEIAAKLQAHPKVNTKRSRIVIITQGPKPTIIATEGRVASYDIDVLPKDQIVDTNAAGDAFVGGFLAQLAQGKSLEDCVRCGHWAARCIIQQSGCTLPPKANPLPDFS